ncbi:MAG: Polysaccharide biosynthesis protein [Candidatus Daviesbacteria bacterium GW2011_GWA2_38_24]|uniref:Polysaccharide biosynthesis protein n=1 Tax=Candidatus Daviesbacteria bacterium GW2011_GWA2_38_24 TaxID=1618422 RepID=A0A0G0MPQ9_9BACT|nr:MAG: Polysaccharide biosynthesis protein [Candidatus Daviesbacteria bacterium GW2011_GWA2_38_24]KKQ79771.1 MAG: Polysaccharide biosynthesis protein [Candidatus Daviesbacteria bacterium GW2011_GWA1_38_7]OGE24046.1 MAG: hypothetical protein A2688_01890 [Candidatus Daviesbacteria bacterium RIFCSPHIGHO2_01_FULL_38_8]
MDTLKKVSLQTLWQLIGKTITSSFTVLILFLITRTYGESGTGVFTLALTYLSFFFLIADFGINAHILARPTEGDYSLEWRKLLGLRLVLSVFLTALALLILPFLPYDNPSFNLAVIFGSLSIIGAGVFATVNAIFQQKLLYNKSITATALGTVIGAGGVGLMILARLPIEVLMSVQVLGWSLTASAGLFLVRGFVKSLLPIIDFGYIKKIFIESWPISLTLVLNTIYFRVDAFILGALTSFTEVGIYNVSYAIFQSALVIPTYIMNSYYPIMIQDLKTDFKKFSKEFKIAGLSLATIGLVGMIVTFVLSPFIIGLITGNRGFEGSSSVLNLLGLGFPAYFLTSLMMWALVLFKKYKTLSLIYFLGLVANLGLNLVLIPRFSFLGAAVATSFSEYLILGAQIIILYKEFKDRSK